MSKSPKETISVRLAPMVIEYIKARASRNEKTQSAIVEEAIAEMMIRDIKGEITDPGVRLGLAIEAAHSLISQVDCERKKKKNNT